MFQILRPDQVRSLRDQAQNLNLDSPRRALRINAGATPDCTKYDSVIVRPQGDRCFLWFTLLEGEEVCVLLDEDAATGGIDWTDVQYVSNKVRPVFCPELAIGTLFIGQVCERDGDRLPMILVEDMLQYKRVDTSAFIWGTTLTYLANIFHDDLVAPHEWTLPVHLAYILNSTGDFVNGYALMSKPIEFCFRAMFDNVPDIVTAAVPKLNLSLSYFQKGVRVPLLVRARSQDDKRLAAFAPFQYGPYQQMVCGDVFIDDKINRDLLMQVFPHSNSSNNKVVTELFECVYHPVMKQWIPVCLLSSKIGILPVSYIDLCR